MNSTEGSGSSRAGGEDLHNEDVFIVDEGLGLYLVCDGVGSTPAGEIAARVAAEAVDEFVDRAGEDFDLRERTVARSIVESAMRYALDSINQAEKKDPELRGLGTTLTMLLAHGRVGVIGHRGDSRAYLLRRQKAYQLTVDHELTEVASEAPSHSSDLDVFCVDFKPGDTVVLCTDGAEEFTRNEDLVRVAGDLAPPILASRIVSTAQREAPGADATAVVVRVRGEREPGWLQLSVPPRATAFGHTLEYA